MSQDALRTAVTTLAMLVSFLQSSPLRAEQAGSTRVLLTHSCAELEARLRDLQVFPIDLSVVERKDDLFRHLRKETDAILVSLSEKTDAHPALSEFAFMCLAERGYSGTATEAVRRIARAMNPTDVLWESTLDFIERGRARTDLKRMLEVASVMKFSRVESLIIVINSIDIDILNEWWNACSSDLNIEFDSVVTWRLFEQAEAGKIKSSEKMLLRLRDLKDVPGRGRLCYVAFGDSSEPDFRDILCRSLVEVETSDDQLILALARRGKWLRENIDPAKLKIDKSRLQILDRARNQEK